MPDSLDGRVVYLEGRVSDRVQAQNELREMIVHLDQKVDRFREEPAARSTNLEESVNERMNGVEQSSTSASTDWRRRPTSALMRSKAASMQLMIGFRL